MSILESSVNFLTHAERPPCCLRIFRDQYVLIGTYDLDKPSGARTGSLEIRDAELILLEKYDTYSAVLDLKISPFDDTVIASAHSMGNLQIWQVCLNENGSFVKLRELANLQIFDTDVLITSLHFSPSNPHCLLVTATTGETRVIDIEHGSTSFSATQIARQYEKVEHQHIQVQGKSTSTVAVPSRPLQHEHSLECWTAEFGTLSPIENVIFTGGDDSTIAAHDMRTGDSIWSNSRIHEAGVVAIKSSTETFRNSKPTSIITGSYDDHIRMIDLRMLGNSIYPGNNVPAANSTTLNLGGGVWRFAESPANAKSNSLDKLLVCCMYDGAKVVTVGADDEFVVDSYIKKNHDSMCYGGDWSSGFIATCSFYDKVVQIWEEPQ
ncbi:LANO_0F01574g1_1 [Lachancea nothofagi CBS 11611]|uniref:methylated diphthine methylhydrolase n=1 Tax=Lachancea nothofagi CBS 11611 TaxID=1266666 RepID=A0A1G4K6B4_9SACH|nr:LANO_0F01574g1_1 [Lachancea nothofagi CBS 11611]